MSKIERHAVSTIAISVYNYTARTGRLVTDERLGEITDYLARIQHPDLDIGVVLSAVEELANRGLLVERLDGLDVIDQQRRVICGRNREDAFTDEDGVVHGGWEDWWVLDLTRGQVLMMEVLS